MRTPALLRPVAAIVVLLAATGCARHEPTAPQRALERTEWQLLSAEVAGRPLAVGDSDAVLRFDGRGGWTAEGCNQFGGTVRLERSELTLVARGCPGQHRP